MALYSERLWLYCASVVFVLTADFVSGGEGVKIRQLRVPEAVANGTEHPVVLDCDYELDVPAKRSGLVVKWFFNKHPAPVYQWIYENKPQALGLLNRKVNLNYKATDDETTMYRAMQIITPTIELSGEYMCTVSTFDTEDSRSQNMTVYVPEKFLEMTQEKPRDDRVTINCSAEGMFPEPNMTIMALDSNDPGFTTVTTKKQNNSKLYDISGTLTVDDIELNSPTTFMCEITIAETQYSNMRKLVYFPGPPTTPSAPLPPEIGETLSTSGGSGSSLSPSFLPVVFVSLVVAVSIIQP